MSSVYIAPSNDTFSSIHSHLQSSKNQKRDAALTDKISSLYLHPTLEALLHLLNHDLDSAHFLVRHFQSAPAYEGMYIHGVLHREEGDFDNCRAWYADVDSQEVFENFWGKATKEENDEVADRRDGGKGAKVPAQKNAREFLDNIEKLKKTGKGDKERLAEEMKKEKEVLMKYCVEKFGTQKFEDATKAWVKPSDDIKSKGQDMVSGGQGHRKF